MVAVYQFIWSFPLLPPSALAVGVSISDIGQNLARGAECYTGFNAVASDTCATSPIYVNLYILFNLGFNVLIVVILKYGSSNLLWLAMTATVPISDLAFAIPGVPGYQPVSWSVGAGLPVIMIGLVVYRFYPAVAATGRRLLGYAPVSADDGGGKRAAGDDGEDA
jgi:hypothetical protein